MSKFDSQTLILLLFGVNGPSEVLKVGDTIEAKIINIDPDEHRVGLSINAMTAKAEAKKEKAEAKEAPKAEAKDEKSDS